MSIKHLLDRPIAFHRILAEITGSVHAGLMLSQAIYWSNRTEDPNGWFWKTQEQWEAETCLTRREQESARERLRSTTFWKEERRGIPAKLFFRVDEDELQAVLLPIKNGGKRHTRCDKSAILDATNQPIYIIETETTSETTTKITKDDQATALFDRLAKEWLTVNPTQLTGHQALVDRYGFDNWLRGFDACSPKTRPNLAYVEKLVISNKLDEPAPKRRAVIVDSVTGEQIEVEI